MKKFKFGDHVRISAGSCRYYGMTGSVINVSLSGLPTVSLHTVPGDELSPMAFGLNEVELLIEKEEKKISPYHTRHIPKGQYGELSKVFEEAEELKDADDQGNPILVLNELADIVGAIDGFVNKYHGMDIEDVIKMMRLNEKAFKSGHRS